MNETKQTGFDATERSSNTSVPPEEAEGMSKAAWLGCFTLFITQMAALQPAVLSSLTKQIDDRIGEFYLIVELD
jgi:hypothetical protein